MYVYLLTFAHFLWVVKLKYPLEKYNEHIQKTVLPKPPITDPCSVLEETASKEK